MFDLLSPIGRRRTVDYDTEVREFTEFACNGKESMTVRHILSYRGLYIQPKSTLKELADFKR